MHTLPPESSLPLHMTDALLWVYDLETTGFDVCKDKIVQMCVLVFNVVHDKLEPVMEFCSYVNPNEKRMSKGAMKVTGLSTTGPNSRLLRRAKFFKQMWNTQFMPKYRAATKHVSPNVVFIVGHNSKAYDDLMLLSELRYSGIGLRACLGTNNIKCADTMALAKQLRTRVGRAVLPRLTLSSLYSYFTNKKLEGAHDALEDCRATLLILEKLWNGNVDSLPHVDLQIQEDTMTAKRIKKGLVTRVRMLHRNKKSQRPRTIERSTSIISCELCGRVRSKYFAQCDCCVESI